MQSKATTVKAYLAELPEDRRKAIESLRKVIKTNLDPDVREGMQYGMIGYFIPHSRYPSGYHCDPKQPLPFAGLASQKNHIGLYMMFCYGDSGEYARFQEAWKKTGNKLDMGKACVRIKKIENVPLDVVGQAFKRMTAKKYIAGYEEALNASPSQRRSKAKPSKAKKTTSPRAKKA